MAEPTMTPAVKPSRLRLREQERAHAAMAAISAFTGDRAAYMRRAQGLPAMIQNLGLAGAIAFLLTKDQVKRLDPADRQLVTDLSDWLLGEKAGVGWAAEPTAAAAGEADRHRRLETAIAHEKTSMLTYRRATTEAKRYATWLKRWSKAAP